MEYLDKDYKDRLEGLALSKELKEACALIHILTMDWISEGFDKEDIKKYFAEIIDKVLD